MTTIVLDTETHKLNGNAIEIAWLPLAFNDNGVVQIDEVRSGSVRLNPLEQIEVGAMAVHHIIDSDLIDKPPHNTFMFPTFKDGAIEYIIGHNVTYDIDVISRCGINIKNIKQICTLALARSCWPQFESHNLTYLTYALTENKAEAREALKGAHCAKDDVLTTAKLLDHIIQSLGIKSMTELYAQSEKARVPTHMPFGKYKGKLLKEVPKDYIRWLLSQLDIDTYLRKELESHLNANSGY